MMRRLKPSGYTFVELAIAMGIMGIMASSVMIARNLSSKQTVSTGDKAYAAEKAVQMFEELKALAGGRETSLTFLDQFSDPIYVAGSGVSFYNPLLTTDAAVSQEGVTNMAKAEVDPVSGNKLTNGHNRYVRRITISRMANDPYARQVDVKVWLYAADSAPLQGGTLLADVGGILRTLSDLYPPSQVLDMYILAVQTIPAWWAQLANMYATYSSIVSDIQSRTPGLVIRPHYVTRSAYGRDQYYTPLINSAQPTSASTALPYVYFYPGTSISTDGTAVTTAFFNPSGVQVCGNFSVDGTVNSTSTLFNGCPSYTVADRNNNGLRYPDEVAMYQAVTNAANTASNMTTANPVTEMSERMLLEGMMSTPASFENAIIVNLHGELLPIPPMRNYSDAAKDTTGSPRIRTVTHPACLYYPGATVMTQTTNVNLMNYAYYDGLDDWTTMITGGSTTDAVTQHPTLAYTTIHIDQYIAPANVTATAIVGNSAVTYQAYPGLTIASAAVGGTTVSSGMQFTVTNPTANTTEILLENTPLRCQPTAGNNLGGLNPNDMLYGAEYIPCAVDTLGNFNTNLASGVTTANNPKNTARWIITVPLLPGQHQIDTCLGQNVYYPNWPVSDPTENDSRTYVWVGNNFPPPYTERFQYLGDPRDCPYLDCKFGSTAIFGTVAGAACTIEPNSFNWWFKDGASAAGKVGINNDGYSGFGAAGDIVGWEGATSSGTNQPTQGMANELDLPRYYETIRNGILNTSAVWGVINGWTCYYYGMGGEFGADQQPFNNGVSIWSDPYLTTNGTATTSSAQEILGAGMGWGGSATYQQMRVVSNTNDTWYERSWLGELYPDSQYSTWTSTGNLPVAVGTKGTSTFYRKQYGSVSTNESPGGTSSSNNGFGRDLVSQANIYGCTAFMNGVGVGSEGGGSFIHNGPNDVGNILSLGQTCYAIFGYPLPASVNVTRPWSISGEQISSEWLLPPYNGERTNLFIEAVNGLSRLFYTVPDNNNQGPWHASGTIQISLPTASPEVSQTAYFVESGLDISANVGLSDLGETALVCTLRTFLDGGNFPVGQGHIYQIPLIETYCDNAAAQYSTPQTINLLVDGAVTTGIPLTIAGYSTFPAGPTPNVWFRWPGYTSTTGNYYTEEYPGYPNMSNSTYSEPVSSLDFNIKVSNNAGGTWYYIQDGGFTGQQAVTGLLDTNAAHLINVTSMPLTYVWNVTNTSNFPQNSYWVCSEAYRHGFPYDYSYHVLNISIIR